MKASNASILKKARRENKFLPQSVQRHRERVRRMHYIATAIVLSGNCAGILR